MGRQGQQVQRLGHAAGDLLLTTLGGVEHPEVRHQPRDHAGAHDRGQRNTDGQAEDEADQQPDDEPGADRGDLEGHDRFGRHGQAGAVQAAAPAVVLLPAHPSASGEPPADDRAEAGTEPGVPVDGRRGGHGTTDAGPGQRGHAAGGAAGQAHRDERNRQPDEDRREVSDDHP